MFRPRSKRPGRGSRYQNIADGITSSGIIAVTVPICQFKGMDKEHVIATLRAHGGELRAAGVVHLSLFGSVARGQSNCKPDVDVMAEFDTSKQYSILDRVRLQNRLADILGVPWI